jgi:hypothetical protein
LIGGATARAVVGDVAVVVVVVVCVVIVGEVVGIQALGSLQQQLFAGFERSHGVIISSVAWSGITVGYLIVVVVVVIMG